MRTARRIEQLPPYLFAELDRKVQQTRAKGVDVVSFGIGDPDLPTPGYVVEAGVKALRDPANHQYPSYYGMRELRVAIAAYYQRRFNVRLDPDSQVLPLIGSKEGIANLATAFVDPGDSVLVCDPGYPVYATSALLAGGKPVPVSLKPENKFLPNLDELDRKVAPTDKVLWLNYPSNPTSAVCELSDLSAAVAFSRKHDLLLAHDAAYVDITYDGFKAPSVLEAPGAADTAIEFGSLSKTFNMTGWRVGWAAGSAQAIEALGRVKTNIDSGIFNALQIAGIAALNGPGDHLLEMIEVYRRRRDAVVAALNAGGLPVEAPLGAIYVWVATPHGQTSVQFCELLLEKAGVVVAPGSGYGVAGEGFVRFSLTISDSRLHEGMDRVAAVLAGLTG